MCPLLLGIFWSKRGGYIQLTSWAGLLVHSPGIHRVFPAFSRRFHRLFRVLFLDAKGGIYYNITVKSKAAATDGNNVEYHEGAGVISK